jgi:hypothetical protein
MKMSQASYIAREQLYFFKILQKGVLLNHLNPSYYSSDVFIIKKIDNN